MEANFFGIKNIILEDNYPVNKGDFQTLKQIFNKYIFNHKPSIYSLIKTYILFNKFFFKKIFFKNYNIKKDLYSISNRIRDGYPEENFFYNISTTCLGPK